MRRTLWSDTLPAVTPPMGGVDFLQPQHFFWITFKALKSQLQLTRIQPQHKDQVRYIYIYIYIYCKDKLNVMAIYDNDAPNILVKFCGYFIYIINIYKQKCKWNNPNFVNLKNKTGFSLHIKIHQHCSGLKIKEFTINF